MNLQKSRKKPGRNNGQLAELHCLGDGLTELYRFDSNARCETSDPSSKICLRVLTRAGNSTDMNPGIILLANSSYALSLYDFHLQGVSASELASAYSLPVSWVEERLEAVRLCLKYQVEVKVCKKHPASAATPTFALPEAEPRALHAR
jgi:hypothetical protein